MAIRSVTDIEEVDATNTAGAMFVQAQKFHYGEGAPKDHVKAATLYSNSCNQKLAQACYELARLYQSSRELSPTPEQGSELSKRFMEKACALGSTRGCEGVSNLNEN